MSQNETNRSLSFLEERTKIPIKYKGKKVQYKIADLEKIADRIIEDRTTRGLSMLIQINPTQVRRFVDPNYSATWYRDPKTAIYYGLIIGEHPDGNPKFRKVQIGEHLTLNLENRDDAIIWAFLRWHPSLEGTPFENNPRYRIFDEDYEAQKVTERANLVEKAINKIQTIPRTKLPWLCRALSIPIGTTSNNKVLRSHLFQYAMQEPKQFLGFVKTKTFDLVTMFRSAVELGVIREDPVNGQYSFRGNLIGVSEQDAIVYLSENQSITVMIQSQTEEKDSVLIRIKKDMESENQIIIPETAE